MKMDFSIEYFLIPKQPVTKFIHLSNKYYKEGGDFFIHHKLDTIDITSCFLDDNDDFNDRKLHK